MNKNPTSSSITLPKGCIYHVGAYFKNHVELHRVVDRQGKPMAWGYRTYDEAVAKAVEMHKAYKAQLKAVRQAIKAGR